MLNKAYDTLHSCSIVNLSKYVLNNHDRFCTFERTGCLPNSRSSWYRWYNQWLKWFKIKVKTTTYSFRKGGQNLPYNQSCSKHVWHRQSLKIPVNIWPQTLIGQLFYMLQKIYKRWPSRQKYSHRKLGSTEKISQMVAFYEPLSTLDKTICLVSTHMINILKKKTSKIVQGMWIMHPGCIQPIN